MATETPLRMSGISVVIPVHNRAQILPMTIRSLLRQSVPAEEIIVVDDGSTDSTAEIAESFGDPVRVVRQKNSGPASARNRGFRESRGKFIHFFDSDDIALPNKHEIQLEALKRESADIAYAPWVKGSFGDEGFVANNLVLQQKGMPPGNLVRALLSNWSMVPHACLFRREIVERAGPFPEDLWVAEDQMMFLHCLLAGAKVVHSPGTLELYRSDNVGKITDSSFDEGKRRHLIHWARFLVSANEACLGGGIDPGKWFGFRGRIAGVLKEFEEFEIEEPEIHSQLQSVIAGRKHLWLHEVYRKAVRVRQGLEVRLGLGRAHPSFKIGKMDANQRTAIQNWHKLESGLKKRRKA